MRLRPLALGAMLGVCAGSSAMAQEMPAVDGKRQTEIGLRLAVIHDSNVSRSSKAVALARGLRPDDYTLRPQLTLSLAQPIGSQMVFLRGAAGYDFHKYNSQLDKRRVDLTGGGIGAVGPCQVTLTGNYAAFQTELDDLTGVVVKNLQEVAGENVSVGCGKQRGLNLVASGAHQEVKNSATRQKTVDHTSDSGTLVVAYNNASLGNASMVFSYATQDFPNRPTATGGIGDGYLTRSLGGNYEKNFGSKLKVTAGVGATLVKRGSAPPGVPLKFTATTYNAGVTYRLGRQLEFAVLANRSVTPSNRAGKLYDIATGAEALAHYKLGTRFLLTGGHRRDDFKSNTDTTVPGPVLTTARTDTNYISVRYRQSADVSLLLDLRQEDRKTNLPAFDYTNTRVSLSASVTF